jgi:hypothetical protein
MIKRRGRTIGDDRAPSDVREEFADELLMRGPLSSTPKPSTTSLRATSS